MNIRAFKQIQILTTAFFLVLSCTSRVLKTPIDSGTEIPMSLEFLLPNTHECSNVIERVGYTLCYSAKYKHAKWVAWILTKDKVLSKETKRKNTFRQDPDIINGPTLADYRGSGYDRGHFAPAGDMHWSELAMAQSFYLTNISPQTPAFNRGIWSRLENQGRKWTVSIDTIIIIAGGILHDSLPTIGVNKIPIPEEFYKIFLKRVSGKFVAIGFIIPNEGSKNHLKKYAVTVDSVQIRTGIDFFHQLPTDLQKKFENSLNYLEWFGHE